jgi:integrase/recombinase XerD
MNARRRRLLADLPLRGLAPKTQPCDLDAVTHRAHHDRRAPDQIRAEALRQYCRYWTNEKQVAESTRRRHLYGIRFFSERTLQRPWPVFELLRPRKRQTLPVVLSVPEVRHGRGLVHNRKAHMCRRLSSACGVRWTAGTRLQASDLAPVRLLGRVSNGQGGHDRCVPRAPRVLAWWREDGQSARPRPWVVPARHGPPPRSPTTLPKTCTVVARRSGLAKDASIPTRRHSSATHLVARGGPRRAMQALLGHTSPRTTARSTPLTPQACAGGPAAINALLAALCALWSPSCQRGRPSYGGTAASTWTRSAKSGGPGTVGRERTSWPAARSPAGGTCTTGTTAAASPMSTAPAAIAAVPSATTTTPKPGWQSGGRNAYRGPPCLSSCPCPTSGECSSAATSRASTTAYAAPRRQRSSHWPRPRLMSGG